VRASKNSVFLAIARVIFLLFALWPTTAMSAGSNPFIDASTGLPWDGSARYFPVATAPIGSRTACTGGSTPNPGQFPTITSVGVRMAAGKYETNVSYSYSTPYWAGGKNYFNPKVTISTGWVAGLYQGQYLSFVAPNKIAVSCIGTASISSPPWTIYQVGGEFEITLQSIQ